MEDSFQSTGSRSNSRVTSITTSKNVSKSCSVASGPNSFSQRSLRLVCSFNHGKFRRGTAHATLFLLKVAALEALRRFSKARCPILWCSLQALQMFCYPPLKWIQSWAPFKGLVKGMQVLSRPLLVLSIATAFFDQSGCGSDTSHDIEDINDINDYCEFSELQTDITSIESTLDARIPDEAPQSLSSGNWLLQLYAELKILGISLPERINEDELHRFYTAANGDFSCLLSSVKKTIRWRETYNILSRQELEMWSDMVFWHGFDVQHRPCLIVRLGLACIALPSHDRPRFAQAVVSQVEHGVLHLVDSKNPQITVLVDCEGLSPLRFPMQVMRSCSTLLQDHFPNRLGCLFVIRLPPVVRVIAQTFIQDLKPVTQQKLKIEGEMYQKVVSEYLQTLPSYLGATCTCMKCSNLNNREMQQLQTQIEETNRTETDSDSNSGEDLPPPHSTCLTDMLLNGNYDQLLRTAMLGILILCVLIAFIAEVYDPESYLD
ncbi:uncharacterized protein LOC132269461 [Cornus florida]|uniref:uncharacterized protein LOC132269461 n=1 Tax=Cornus florida TaxID=4283 RepID=UPI00289E7903|nr:uncharacterized protein LOC132269461 [Cornus florida]